MAKIRHRTFEIFEFLQEANDALASKSAREKTYSLDPDLWRFHQLDTTILPSGVVHVRFKQSDGDQAKSPDVLGKDLTDLEDLLTNGSRVLLDFEGVVTFEPDEIVKLTEFEGKLQNKGSRVVLCNLAPPVQAFFFPHLRTNTGAWRFVRL